MLTLAEELYILAIQERKGTLLPLAKMAMPIMLTGACLVELYLEGRVHLVREQLIVKNHHPVEHPQLNQVLKILDETHEKKTLKQWMEDLFKESKQIQKELLEGLIKKRILKLHEYQFLGLFPIRRYFFKKQRYKRDRLKELYSHVIKHKKLESRMMALISLIHAGGLHKSIFPKEQKGKAIQCIEEIMKSENIKKNQDEFLVLIHEIIISMFANRTTESAEE